MHGSWYSPLCAIPAFTWRRTTLLLAVGLARRRQVGPQGLPLVLLFCGLAAAGQIAMVTALPDFAASAMLALALPAALLWQAAAERRAMGAAEHATRNLPGIFDQLQIAYAALFSGAIILIVAQ